MAIDLSEPLSWSKANAEENAMLRDLQANVLKGHGRGRISILLLRFDPGEAAGCKAFLHALDVTDAHRQLKESDVFNKTGKPGGLITLCMLSASGYQALGILSKARADPAFRAGLQKRQEILSDPPVTQWERHFRKPVHAMILLAHGSAAGLRMARQQVVDRLPAGARLVGEEAGASIDSLSSPGEAVEHFGYVDGRSNPLLLKEDIEKESKHRGGTSVWDPGFGIGLALVRDPASTAPTSFGSYLVLRKLEQDVRGFKKAEKALGRVLQLRGRDKERAGAMIVGRFEDGTPVCLQSVDGLTAPVPNDFDYSGDPSGSRCPIQSHIRKVNPRGENAIPGVKTVAQERAHSIVRRGMTYGNRTVHPNSASLRSSDLPSAGVGLLFMAYQGDIGRQFEFIQAQWANKPVHGGPRRGGGARVAGLDPIIGATSDDEESATAAQSWPRVWGRDLKSSWSKFDFRGYVKMLGGEYFFAPSLTALKTL